MRTPTVSLLASACFGFACGAGPVDASRAITMLAGDDFTEEATQEVARAGYAWNQEFGTQLAMEADGDQSIDIVLDEKGCMNERFQRTHARARQAPPEVLVCPETAEDPLQLFETLRHELGHVLGIATHATSPSAVMAAISTSPFHWFQEEDRDLFFSANPAFRPNPAE